MTINELGQKVRDIKAQSEHQRRAKEAECLEHMKTQADRFHHEISTLESELNVRDEHPEYVVRFFSPLP